MATGLKKITQEILESADIEINGKNPWDIQVHDNGFYKKILTQGSLGLGESYMDGWWDCKKLDEFFYRIIKNNIKETAKKHLNLSTKLSLGKIQIENIITNRQNLTKSRRVGIQHYDVGNKLYELMLDSKMQYSCGYWKNARTLEEAQIAKLDLISRKLELKPNMTVLDIGCGWGGLLKFAAEQYKIKGLGVTISKEQARYAKEKCKNLNIEIRDQDYRHINQRFDRIVSVGMFEHVGKRNYRQFMKKASDSLKDEGLFLLHTIGQNVSGLSEDPFIAKYIFPGGELPSLTELTDAAEGLFVIRDVHNFADDYDKTLMSWNKNFQDKWYKINQLEQGKYDNRFKRMWEYYLLSCAGSFRAGNLQLWQIVLSKPGYNNDYKSVR
jgi:cyclopropane-fatty-acyl-phospholipid synthase